VSTPQPLDIVIFGLSITSAWGNGHATTYRALVRALNERGHRVRFFERDLPWYADNRDLADPQYCKTHVYSSIAQLDDFFPDEIGADLIILGSFVPEGAALAEWLLPRAAGLTAFYDIDTPVTLATLERGGCEYLTRELIPRFDLYLSFTGGPVLQRLRNQFGALRPRPFHCSVEPRDYYPVTVARAQYDLGYLGTYSPDRQPALERLLLQPARAMTEGRFCVAGPQYPESLTWPANVQRIEHLPPTAHRQFYNDQRMTLNITRADMVASGYSPSVRLFEAAACGVPIITDEWSGLEEFFEPDRDILVVRSGKEVLDLLHDVDADKLRRMGARARARVLTGHTALHRALELEGHVREVRDAGTSPVEIPGWVESTLRVCTP
jgi:spore maturation protein CgeB